MIIRYQGTSKFWKYTLYDEGIRTPSIIVPLELIAAHLFGALSTLSNRKVNCDTTY